MADTIQKIISLKAKDRISGTSNNFICSINNLKNIHWFSLQDVLIPMSHYPITTDNNLIKFNDGGDKTATLDIGFYTKSELITAIKNKMDTASGGTLVFTVVVNDQSEKINISSTANFTLRFNETNTPFKLLGYEEVLYSGASSYIAPNILNINRKYNTFNIRSEQLTQHHKHVHTSDNISNIIAVANNSIASPKGYFHYTQDEHNNQMIKFDPASRIKYIDINITDIDNKQFDLNGNDGVVVNIIAYIRD